MPGRDKTGPLGQGERTGRGFGDCPVTSDRETIKNGGRGLGLRHGWRRFFNPFSKRSQIEQNNKNTK